MRDDIQYWGEYVKLNSTGEIVRLIAYDDMKAHVEIDGEAVSVGFDQISKLNEAESIEVQRLKAAILSLLGPKPPNEPFPRKSL
jgi:hypothetical protein